MKRLMTMASLAWMLILVAACAGPADQGQGKEEAASQASQEPLVLKVSHQWAQGDVRDRLARTLTVGRK